MCDHGSPCRCGIHRSRLAAPALRHGAVPPAPTFQSSRGANLARATAASILIICSPANGELTSNSFWTDQARTLRACETRTILIIDIIRFRIMFINDRHVFSKIRHAMR